MWKRILKLKRQLDGDRAKRYLIKCVFKHEYCSRHSLSWALHDKNITFQHIIEVAKLIGSRNDVIAFNHLAAYMFKVEFDNTLEVIYSGLDSFTDQARQCEAWQRAVCHAANNQNKDAVQDLIAPEKGWVALFGLINRLGKNSWMYEVVLSAAENYRNDIINLMLELGACPVQSIYAILYSRPKYCDSIDLVSKQQIQNLLERVNSLDSLIAKGIDLNFCYQFIDHSSHLEIAFLTHPEFKIDRVPDSVFRKFFYDLYGNQKDDIQAKLIDYLVASEVAKELNG